MYIGFYKSVESNSEFYSHVREDLNFPTQVEYKKEKYLLNKTIQVSSESQIKNVFSTAKNYNIDYNVQVS